MCMYVFFYIYIYIMYMYTFIFSYLYICMYLKIYIYIYWNSASQLPSTILIALSGCSKKATSRPWLLRCFRCFRYGTIMEPSKNSLVSKNIHCLVDVQKYLKKLFVGAQNIQVSWLISLALTSHRVEPPCDSSVVVDTAVSAKWAN